MENIFLKMDITPINFIVVLFVSLTLGLLTYLVHKHKNRCSKEFGITLTILPPIVATIIILVNGNLGTGVAVMGAFSLVRFRSIPGTSKEIGSIFLAMALGLACGTGYIFIAFILLFVCGALTILFSMNTNKGGYRNLKITIPENLDYCGVFDDIFLSYTAFYELDRVKLTGMGSLYELCYSIELKDVSKEKEMLDEIRCRNGNLLIICSRKDEGSGL